MKRVDPAGRHPAALRTCFAHAAARQRSVVLFSLWIGIIVFFTLPILGDAAHRMAYARAPVDLATMVAWSLYAFAALAVFGTCINLLQLAGALVGLHRMRGRWLPPDPGH